MKQSMIKAPEVDVSLLLDGIVRSTDEEIASLEGEASDYARAKANAANAKITAIGDDTKEAIRQQVDAIRKNLDSRLALERKKADLGARDRLVRAIESQARLLLEEKAAGSDYRILLLEWTVEASVGLGSGPATVNCCLMERPLIDDAFLREAEARILALSGRSATLRLAENPPLGERGIELSSDGGRLCYDNRIGTRFARSAGAIRSIVYKVAYGDGIKL